MLTCRRRSRSCSSRSKRRSSRSAAAARSSSSAASRARFASASAAALRAVVAPRRLPDVVAAPAAGAVNARMKNDPSASPPPMIAWRVHAASQPVTHGQYVWLLENVKEAKEGGCRSSWLVQNRRNAGAPMMAGHPYPTLPYPTP